MEDLPYLKVADERRKMGGKGAPTPTVFGVLGRTAMSPLTKSLGGLVIETTKGVRPEDDVMKAKKVKKNTEKKIVGTPAKTHIPGAHYGQVPYAGKFMSMNGEKL